MAGTSQYYSSAVDDDGGLDNRAESIEIPYNDNLLIQGFRSIHGVENYLNIPYGRITARFCIAEMVRLEKLRGRLDASRYGPRAPQGPDTLQPLLAHMMERRSNTQRMSEMDCLNVNVYTPPDSISSAPFPILGFIHGGGFVAGDSLTEFDGNHLVKRSLDIGKPVVVITISYRLNFFGFFASHEILDEQEAR
ncbi:MAG: hypothetical protein CYPHOPRED_002477, partial [Cyphobasidiales sp. Tagirdzhanova-0007]